MVRSVLHEPAALASLVLFLVMITICAHVLCDDVERRSADMCAGLMRETSV